MSTPSDWWHVLRWLENGQPMLDDMPLRGVKEVRIAASAKEHTLMEITMNVRLGGPVLTAAELAAVKASLLGTYEAMDVPFTP